MNKKKKSARSGDAQEFHLLHISLLREYLELDFGAALKEVLPFAFDIEHVIDDFILLCMFIGNDFVPNLPGLGAAFFFLHMLTARYCGGKFRRFLFPL